MTTNQECGICHQKIIDNARAETVYVRARSGSRLSTSRRVHLTCLGDSRVVKLHDVPIVASRQGLRRR